MLSWFVLRVWFFFSPFWLCLHRTFAFAVPAISTTHPILSINKREPLFIFFFFFFKIQSLINLLNTFYFRYIGYTALWLVQARNPPYPFFLASDLCEAHSNINTKSVLLTDCATRTESNDPTIISSLVKFHQSGYVQIMHLSKLG